MRRERTQKDEAGCGKKAAPKPVPPKSIHQPLHGNHLFFSIDCGTTSGSSLNPTRRQGAAILLSKVSECYYFP
jgi:hypothetical protein